MLTFHPQPSQNHPSLPTPSHYDTSLIPAVREAWHGLNGTWSRCLSGDVGVLLGAPTLALGEQQRHNAPFQIVLPVGFCSSISGVLNLFPIAG